MHEWKHTHHCLQGFGKVWFPTETLRRVPPIHAVFYVSCRMHAACIMQWLLMQREAQGDRSCIETCQQLVGANAAMLTDQDIEDNVLCVREG